MRSRANTLLNFGACYAVNQQLALGLDVFNLAGQKGNDIKHFHASCTAGEALRGECGGGIESRHVHPMEPRTVRVTTRWMF